MKFIQKLIAKPAVQTAIPILSGAGIASYTDLMTHKDDGFLGGEWTTPRTVNFGINTLLGGGGTYLWRHGDPIKGIAMGTSPFAKDLVINSQDVPRKFTRALDAFTNQVASTQANAKFDKYKNIGLGVLGIGALGLGALGVGKYLTRKDTKDTGKIKLKLPGKKGDPDTDATVELPLNTPGLSPKMIEGLSRSIRTQTRKNVKANMMKRDPNTGKLIPMEEYEAQYGNLPQVQKRASTGAAFNEGAGMALSSILPGVLGAKGADKLADIIALKNEKGRLALRVLGAAAGVTIPNALGAGLGGIVERRTAEEQEGHDRKGSVLDLIVPGYAAYQNTMRGRAQSKSSGDDFDYGYDDFDKEAGMMPQGPPPPLPTNEMSRVPVANPTTPETRTQSEDPSTSLDVNPKDVKEKMNNIVNKIKSRELIRCTTL